MPFVSPSPTVLAPRQASSISSQPASTSSAGNESSGSGTPTTTPNSDLVSMTSSTSASTTSDTPFFTSPTNTQTSEDNSNLRTTKNAVESAIIVIAAVLIISLSLWRVIRLRRRGRSLAHFFSAHPEPDVPARPRAVPRTTGLPPHSGSHVSVIYDTLNAPVPVLYHQSRRGRGRRTHGGDIDRGGRRGNIAHPDDPDEFLPVYDDKDMLPRYQDVGLASRTDGRSPNGLEAGSSDAIPLVTRLQLPSGATEDGHPTASTDSHGHEDPSRGEQPPPAAWYASFPDASSPL